jgi:hypothetical protein
LQSVLQDVVLEESEAAGVRPKVRS